MATLGTPEWDEKYEELTRQREQSQLHGPSLVERLLWIGSVFFLFFLPEIEFLSADLRSGHYYSAVAHSISLVIGLDLLFLPEGVRARLGGKIFRQAALVLYSAIKVWGYLEPHHAPWTVWSRIWFALWAILLVVFSRALYRWVKERDSMPQMTAL